MHILYIQIYLYGKKLCGKPIGLIDVQVKTNDTLDGSSGKPNSTMDKSEMNISDKQSSALASGTGLDIGSESFKRQSSEAALTADDTTSLASLVSSPGAGDRPKPVNFDFMRPDVRRDPHIVQPLPLRISSPPDSPSLGGCSKTFIYYSISLF